MVCFRRKKTLELSLLAASMLFQSAALGMDQKGPFTPPTLEWSVQVMSGAPLDLDTHLTQKPSRVARQARLQIASLSCGPDPLPELRPLSSFTRSILSPFDVQPIRSHSLLAPGAMTASGSEAVQAWRKIQEINPRNRSMLLMKTGSVPLGGTLLFTGKDQSDGRSISILLSLPTKKQSIGAQCALRLQAPFSSKRETELLLLEREKNPDIEARLLLFPSPFQGTPKTWIVAYLEWYRKETTHSMTSLSMEQGGPLSFLEPRGPYPEVPSLKGDMHPIPKDLLHLLQSSAALAARDVLLSGSPTIVTELKTTWSSSNAQQEDPMRLAWRLERQALLWACDQIERVGEECPYRGLLYIHVGELAHHLYKLTPLLNEAEGLSQFKESVIKENLRSLEERTLFSRIQAQDWLQMQGYNCHLEGSGP